MTSFHYPHFRDQSPKFMEDKSKAKVHWVKWNYYNSKIYFTVTPSFNLLDLNHYILEKHTINLEA